MGWDQPVPGSLPRRSGIATYCRPRVGQYHTARREMLEASQDISNAKSQARSGDRASFSATLKVATKAGALVRGYKAARGAPVLLGAVRPRSVSPRKYVLQILQQPEPTNHASCQNKKVRAHTELAPAAHRCRQACGVIGKPQTSPYAAAGSTIQCSARVRLLELSREFAAFV